MTYYNEELSDCSFDMGDSQQDDFQKEKISKEEKNDGYFDFSSEEDNFDDSGLQGINKSIQNPLTKGPEMGVFYPTTQPI